jgi:hypothetical protein
MLLTPLQATTALYGGPPCLGKLGGPTALSTLDLIAVPGRTGHLRFPSVGNQSQCSVLAFLQLVACREEAVVEVIAAVDLVEVVVVGADHHVVS